MAETLTDSIRWTIIVKGLVEPSAIDLNLGWEKRPQGWYDQTQGVEILSASWS